MPTKADTNKTGYIMALTDTGIKNLKHSGAPAGDKHTDAQGLHLLVKAAGKYWRLNYRFDGKQKTLALGVYPAVSLANARKRRDAARELLANDTDPAQAKRIEKANKVLSNANTFEAVARHWHENKLGTWQPRTAANILHRLEQDIFPLIGKQPITSIKAPVILDVLRQIEKRGALEIAKRQGQVCGQIFRYAIINGWAESDPVPNLRGALKPTDGGHHAAISVAELPEFLQALRKNEVRMFLPTRILMRLMMLTFVRTSELIETPWAEIDLENEVWVIPWQRMKMGKKKVKPRKENHDVFLPRQGWALLRELHSLTGGNTYLFPNQRDHAKPVSNGAILAALKRMGYQNQMTGHGFRSLAKGILKTLKHDIGNIERQLSHSSGEAYGGAYDRESFKEERRLMMQEYADYLDTIEHGGNVIHASFRAA